MTLNADTLSEKKSTIIIKQGTSLNSIINIIDNSATLQHPQILKIILKIIGYERQLKYGEYFIYPHESAYSIIQKIKMGISLDRKFLLPAGLTNYQVTQRLFAEKSLVGDVTFENIRCLFPDTYNFKYGDSRMSIIKRMANKCEQEFSRTWSEHFLSSKGKIHQLDQVIILASIVEKEASDAEEMPRIAAIFLNRLQLNMKLQSCATVIYTISEKTGILNKHLTIQDTKEKSPYNTYYVNGLPTEPICHPSLSALLAVLKPMDTKELYFIADEAGKHHFFHNFKDHNNFKQRVHKQHQEK